MFIGLSSNSNEAFIGLPNGNVVKSRSVARVMIANRWDKDAVLKIRGIPGSLNPAGAEDINPQIEESDSPHLDGDAEEREDADQSMPEAQASSQKPRGSNTQIRITQRDVRLYGYTDGAGDVLIS